MLGVVSRYALLSIVITATGITLKGNKIEMWWWAHRPTTVCSPTLTVVCPKGFTAAKGYTLSSRDDSTLASRISFLMVSLFSPFVIFLLPIAFLYLSFVFCACLLYSCSIRVWRSAAAQQARLIRRSVCWCLQQGRQPHHCGWWSKERFHYTTYYTAYIKYNITYHHHSCSSSSFSFTVFFFEWSRCSECCAQWRATQPHR